MSATAPALPCRLLVDGPASGAWNMAVDEVLLESAAEQGQSWLRFYTWSEPTLSLGYFQSAADRARHAPSRGAPLVRRQTGGGAILHDDELTYALVVPLAHPLAADSTRLYQAVHGALVETLADCGVTAALSTLGEEAGSRQPFLCFQRRTSLDVLVGTAKVCGSAQRRRRGAVLQHGSLLLGTSPLAPELPGIRELTGNRLEAALLAETWGPAMARHLPLVLASGGLSESERHNARTLALEKYSAAAWNLRR